MLKETKRVLVWGHSCEIALKLWLQGTDDSRLAADMSSRGLFQVGLILIEWHVLQQKVRSAEPEKVLKRISSFCSKENFLECAHFLDQELSVFGYPKVCCQDLLDQVTLVNITHDLLQTYRRSLKAQSDTHDVLRNAESDTTRLQHLLSYAKEDLASKERELKSKSIEETHLNQRIETLKKKFKTEQERCRRLTADMTSRDTQFKHEKKKNGQEIEKLQTKLHQLLQDKRQERMVGIDILNSLQRADGKRGKWNTDRSKKSSEQDMYRLIITNYEDSQKQLLKENADMRNYLKQMQDELMTALNEKAQSSDKSCLSESGEPCGRTDALQGATLNSSNTSFESSDPMSEGVFEMPYDMVKEDIEKSLNSKWKALKKEIRKERKECVERNGQLDKTPEHERVIREQQELIDYLTSSQGNSDENPHLRDSYFLEEKAELEKKKNTFQQQRLAFEKERKTYTEALIQLGNDRQSFEREKASWMTHNFMQITPLRGDQVRKKRQSPSAVKLRNKNRSLSSSWDGSPSKTSLNWSDGEASEIGRSVSPHLSPPGINETYLARTSRTDDRSPEAHQPLAEAGYNQSWHEKNRPFTPPATKTALRSSSSPSIPASPSTVELYRVLGLRHRNKENVDHDSLMDVESNRKSSTSKRHHAADDVTISHRKRSGRHAPVESVKAALFQS